MPIALFELLCLAVVAATLAAMARTRDARALAADYAALAVAAWVGEESCVLLYRYYEYAGSWHARLDQVPLLVPLIWPLVVLSARDAARAVWPAAGPWLPACLVAFDASLVEVVAVRAGLWRWAEPGHLGVPLVGILGWGFFAVGAVAMVGAPRRRWLAIVAGPLAAHALILASWWGVFRRLPRVDLGALGFLALAAASLVFLVGALRARARGTLLPPSVWGPRVLAAGLFVALLGVTAPTDRALWLHAALVAAPWLVLTGTRSAAAPRAAIARSR